MDLIEIIIAVGILGFIFFKIYNFVKNNKDRLKDKNPFK